MGTKIGKLNGDEDGNQDEIENEETEIPDTKDKEATSASENSLSVNNMLDGNQEETELGNVSKEELDYILGREMTPEEIAALIAGMN